MRSILFFSAIAFLLFFHTNVCAQKKQKLRDIKRGASQAPVNLPGTSNITLPSHSIIGLTPKNEEAKSIPKTLGPAIDLENDSYFFGKAIQGEVIKYSFKFKNTGGSDLLLTNVKPSCGCTVSEWPRHAIKPGESAQIDVKFNTSGKLGKQKKAISVFTNIEQSNLVVLYLEGEVINPLLLPSSSSTTANKNN
jgi:hypothetical protein